MEEITTTLLNSQRVSAAAARKLVDRLEGMLEAMEDALPE